MMTFESIFASSLFFLPLFFGAIFYGSKKITTWTLIVGSLCFVAAILYLIFVSFDGGDIIRYYYRAEYFVSNGIASVSRSDYVSLIASPLVLLDLQVTDVSLFFACILAFCCFSFLAQYSTFSCNHIDLPRIILLYPICYLFFWVSSLGKDSIIYSIVFILLSGFTRKNLGFLLSLSFLLPVMFIIRPYTLIPLLLAFVAALYFPFLSYRAFLLRIRLLAINKNLLIIIPFASFALYMVFIFSVRLLSSSPDSDTFVFLLDQKYQAFSKGVLSLDNCPYVFRLIYSLFGPIFPLIGVKSLTANVVSLANTSFFLLLLHFVLQFRSQLSSHLPVFSDLSLVYRKSASLLTFALVYIIINGVMLSLVSGNLGTLMRHQSFSLFLMYFSVLNCYLSLKQS